ncbi:MAG: UDP-2,3-diacylglucosamine diphosphatase [candidate division WOR-3 bacterium]|nr:UDP-2,3-diacylglucosamine diphosphatase [candidate division WOR-3 bacterium]
MDIYLFSDAHFGFSKDETEKFQKYKALMDKVKKSAGKFIIIGDLFDFWFEYESVIFSNYFSVLAELYEVSKHVETIYIAGNHDLWIGKFFKNLNIKTVIGTYELPVNGRKIYIAHGDDLKFRIKTRDILRNRLLTFLFKQIHPDIGIKIAKFVSKVSRKAHNSYPLSIPEWLWKYVEIKNIEILIVGHLHSPIYEERNGRKVACIGDWLNHFTYGVIKDNKLMVLNIDDSIVYALNL